MPIVFISHSAKDSTSARRITEDLRKNNIQTWLAEDQILPGDSIQNKVKEAISTCDYFLVLLSTNSIRSKWVLDEIASAVAKDPISKSKRIIPVRIDDSPLPSILSQIRYVDLQKDYQEGIKELLSVFQLELPISTPSVKEIIDPIRLSDEITKEEKAFKGSGYLVTTILGIATLVVSAVAAIPSFYQVFSNKAEVYYSVSHQRIGIPLNIDQARLAKILSTNNIAGSTVEVNVINKGDTAAKSIKAGLSVNGIIEYANSIPVPKPAPVWVAIDINDENTPLGTYYTFTFKDLVPNHAVSAIVGYNSPNNVTPDVEVIFDGRPAQKVASIEQVPSWSLWRLFEIPIQVLLGGILLTGLVGLVVVIRSNPRLRDSLLLILKELNPPMARVIDIVIKMSRL